MKESHFISAGLCTLTYFWTKNVHFREEIFKEIFMIFLLRYRLKRWTQRFFNILTRIFLTTKKSSTSILLEFFFTFICEKKLHTFLFSREPTLLCMKERKRAVFWGSGKKYKTNYFLLIFASDATGYPNLGLLLCLEKYP